MTGTVFIVLLALGVIAAAWSVAATLPQVIRLRHAEAMLQLRDELWEDIHFRKEFGGSDLEAAEYLERELDSYARVMRRLTTPHEIAHLIHMYREERRAAPRRLYEHPKLTEFDAKAGLLLVAWFRYRPANMAIKFYRRFSGSKRGPTPQGKSRTRNSDDLRHARMMARDDTVAA